MSKSFLYVFAIVSIGSTMSSFFLIPIFISILQPINQIWNWYIILQNMISIITPFIITHYDTKFIVVWCSFEACHLFCTNFIIEIFFL